MEEEDIKEKQQANRRGCLIFLVALCALPFFLVLITSGSRGGSSKPKPVLGCEQYNSNAIVMSHHFVESHLKYPGSSHVPSYWESPGAISCNGTTFTISNWVDAANGFNAKQRRQYLMSIRYKGGDWADISNWDELSFVFDSGAN